MNDIDEVDDVDVAQLTQQGNLADRGAGNALVGVLDFDFLNCYRLKLIRNGNLKFILRKAKTVVPITYLVEFEVDSLKNDAVGAFTDLLA